MEDITSMIINYGSSTVIIGLFLWDWAVNKKKTNELLEEIKISNINMSKSLDLLKENYTSQNSILMEHDKRVFQVINILEYLEKNCNNLNEKINMKGVQNGK